MKSEDVQRLYDEEYAAAYDARFLTADYTDADTAVEFGILKTLLADGGPWLDVGCGTGYCLSKFRAVRRAGLDLSPAMLELARKRNPGIELQQGDFRAARDEWKNNWRVVSCMWAAYAYVDTMAEVETTVRNLVDWTAEGGSLFLPIVDLPALRPTDVSFVEQASFFSGKTFVNGCIWSWSDGMTGRLHRNLIAPHLEQFLTWLSPHFEEIHVLDYPAVEGVRRAALVAKKKRSDATSSTSALIIRPADAHTQYGKTQATSLDSFTIEELVGAVRSRLRPARIWRGLVHRLRPSQTE